ncbi:MAG: hypothetical protein GXP21_08765 [Gammaproteobacteria bacterium]|nr:hypothetical protein [Gammaproteobacteria bacterium]
MTLQKIGAPLRAFFIVSSTVSWIGLWLTGFNIAHWFLYIAPTAFLIAGITGICPGMMLSNKLFEKKETTQT